MSQKNKKQRVQYGFKKILTGSDLSSRRLALMEIESREPGPVVWLTAAVHGDEVGGIAVVQEVFKQLRKYPLLKGTVKAMPLMNPLGLETGARRIPLSGEDLNRSFPGDEKGRLSERIAKMIFQTIAETRPALVIDLHNDWIKSIPHLLIDPKPAAPGLKESYERARKLAGASGFIIVEEDEKDIDELKKTLTGSLLYAGIPSFTLELGESYVVNEEDVKNGLAAVWNILKELKMAEEVYEFKIKAVWPVNLKGKILLYSDKPHAQSSGLVHFLIKPGDILRPQDPIARIYNVFGKLHKTVRAEETAVVLGYSDSSVAFPGARLVALGVIK